MRHVALKFLASVIACFEVEVVKRVVAARMDELMLKSGIISPITGEDLEIRIKVNIGYMTEAMQAKFFIGTEGKKITSPRRGDSAEFDQSSLVMVAYRRS